MTKPIKLNSLESAAELLSEGKIGVIPTDTVYGVVCCAANKSAVARLYELKNRTDKPGTIIASSTEQLVELGIPARYLKPLEQYWPGPISIVVPTAPGLSFLDLGKFALAVRVSDDSTLNMLINAVGPLLSTSANLPGEPTAGSMQSAQDIFGDSVDFYVDGGDLSDRQPSTIIRIVDDAVEVLREGAVKVSEQTGELIS